MKVYISYFYQIRFFKPHQIPISTAVWDPTWYHDFKFDNKHVFIDKNGVIVGFRYPDFNFPAHYYDALKKEGLHCEICEHNRRSCKFMEYYYSYLKTLSFSKVMQALESIAKICKDRLGFEEEPEIILIVHESDKCKCAERPVLRKWFNDNHVELPEWRQGL